MGKHPWNYNPIAKKCEQCSKEFLVSPSRKNAKFCSYDCKAKSMLGKVPAFYSFHFEKGHNPWNKGKKLGFIPKSAFKKGQTPWNYNPVTKVCTSCGSDFSVPQCRKDTARYCSQKCYRKRVDLTCPQCQKKFTVYSHLSQKRKFCSLTCTQKYYVEERSPMWKGDDVGYISLHVWVKKHLGNPEQCEHCGEKGLYGGYTRMDGVFIKKWSIQWANKSGEYKRELGDWTGLCVKCHYEYDLQNGFIELRNKDFKGRFVSQ